MSATAAETLGKHFANLKAGDIPKVKIAECKALVRDYLGVALAGSQTGSGKAARAFALDLGGKAENTLIGYGDKVTAVHGALVNAISSHSIELDDVDILALFHFSPPVVSAALAAAERENASGEEFIAAVVAGCDMMARASDAMNFSLRNRGYHTTPVCGVFGATIAAARLFKLNEEQTVSALGMAGAQASGLMEMYGPSMQKRFNPGPAARNGVTAAQMAKHGFTGAATIFDGERGVLKAFTDENDVAALTRNLGTDYPVHIEYKAYSCARPIHNAIDCALAVRKELKEPLGAITSMTMRRHPAWANYHLNTRPKTYHEAQVSLPYSVAVALIEGAAFFPQYSNDKLGDKEILRLSDLLKIVPDDSLPRGVSCHLVVETAGGAKLESQIDHPKGSIAYPMTDAEMRNKVHLLGDAVIGAEQVNRMISAIDDVENLDSISKLTRLTAPGG
jgi:2-methylcitrate dehydratase PrpD